ncbi:MAG: hypothetical protein HZA31_11935 [Opitutae bacterium]|nr:hypothetical protein [Opitutae bacterium]
MPDSISSKRRAEYALGYVVLGLFCEATEELESIAPADRATPETLTAWVELHMATKQWDRVLEVAPKLAAAAPTNDRGWIAWAFALREVARIADAREVLLRAETLHGNSCALLHYNLACYECLLGRLSEARRRLEVACRMEKSFREDASSDPDLQALQGGSSSSA